MSKGQAQVMKDATKDVSMHKDVEPILTKTSDTAPSGKYFNTNLSNWEDNDLKAQLKNIRQMEAEYTGQYFNKEEFQSIKRFFNEEYFTESEFKALKNFFMREEEVQEVEPVDDEESMDVVAANDDEMVVASTAEDVNSDVGTDTAVVSVETPSSDVDDEIDSFLTIDSDTEIGIGIDDGKLVLDTGEADIRLDIDRFMDDDMGEPEVAPEPMPIEDDYTEAEKRKLAKIKRNVEMVIKQVQGFKEACKGKKKKTKKEKVVDIKGKKDPMKEMEVLQLKLERLLKESNTNKSEKVIYESLDQLTKKFDKILENAFKEDDDFSINTDIENIDDALDKSEDILSGSKDDDTEEGQATLHVTLPSGVSADDVVVKVVEESEGSPVIQIELPAGANVDEMEVEATVSEEIDVEGLDDAPKEKDVDDMDDADKELANEDLDEELPKEEEDKLEEALKLLNKKLLPIAENAKFNGYKANKVVMEAAMKPDTSYNTNILKQTHLYYENDGKKASDYRYPIADVIDGKFYIVPEAINKMTEMFSNPHMVRNIDPAVVKIVRARLVPYLEMMKKEIPWKTRKSSLIVKENGMLLSLVRNRETHDPTKALKKIRTDMLKENTKW